MQREISIIELPHNKTSHPIDKNQIYKFYLNYITDSVNERIGVYYSRDYIYTKLTQKIKSIEPNHSNTNIASITEFYEDSILKLPDYFFNFDLPKEESKPSYLFGDYPFINQLLATYGLYALFAPDEPIPLELQLKKLLATYFATQSTIINPCQYQPIKFADKIFSSYSLINPLCENIIKELSMILGEEALLKSLEKDSKYLTNIIDKTIKKKLGKKILDNLIQLDITCQQLIDLVNVEHDSDQLLKDKIMPMYRLIINYSPAYQNQILNQLELENFDFSVLKKFEIDPNKLIPLTFEEKQLLTKHISNFDNNFDNLIPFLSANCPNISKISTPINNSNLSKEDFSFLNKILTVMNFQSETYDNLCLTITQIWKQTNDQILFQLLPNYLKHNNSPIDLESMLILSSYTTPNTYFDFSKEKSINEDYNPYNNPAFRKILQKETKEKNLKKLPKKA